MSRTVESGKVMLMRLYIGLDLRHVFRIHTENTHCQVKVNRDFEGGEQRAKGSWQLAESREQLADSGWQKAFR